MLVLLLCAYYATKPFYIWSSGLPQFSDVIGLIFIVGIALNVPPTKQTSQRRIIAYLFAFALYAAFVNIVWAMIIHQWSAALPAAYYLYNVALYYCVLTLLSSRGAFAINILSKVITYSICVIAVMVMALGASIGTYARELAFFNNPNQLGYWALLSVCCAATLHLVNKMGKRHALISYLGGALLIVLSLGKAAMLSAAMVFIYVATRKTLYAVFTALAVIVLIIFSGSQALFSAGLYNRVLPRLENIGHQTDDSLAGRGYDRIFEYPQYLLLGAGEGNLIERFGSDPSELHSTIGTVVFSYGVVGLLIFLRALFLICRCATPHSWALMLAPMLYGLTHQGIRFSVFWIFLALLTYVGTSPSGGIEDSHRGRVPKQRKY